MQNYALTVNQFLDHAAKWWGEQEIVAACGDATDDRISYTNFRVRSNLLSGALQSIGLCFGDRVGTLAWNTRHHLEMYYATMGAGLVCHTLNPRFTPEHLATILNDAGNRAVAVASNLVPLLRKVLPKCPLIESVIVMDDVCPDTNFDFGPEMEAWFHDDLIGVRGRPVPWGQFDENAAAGLCYTSGTTGKPKGVVYSHRSNYLHTLRNLQADSIGLKSSDVVLVAVPMFHANGWGLPFAAPGAGAKMVLPGRNTDGARLAELMRRERVTLAVGVQTVWMGVVDHLEKTGTELPDLQRLLIGGSKCPDALIRRMEKCLGARVQTSWGMTELSPVGTVMPMDAPAEAVATCGRPPIGLDMKLTDADGVTLESQRNSVGHLKVKGHSVVERYFNSDTEILDDDGYFDTGDLACINDAGYLTICGRSKDLIKSGGEWINPVEIEGIVGGHPSVALVAVIGKPDKKWEERPVLVVETRAGVTVDSSELLELVREKVASWWVPDEVVMIDSMPLAATGKIDKRQLRECIVNQLVFA